MASPGSTSAGDCPARRVVVTRAEIAQAAAVTDQAVSNWVRRHAGFPQPVQVGRRAGYPVAEVAAWLDRFAKARRNTPDSYLMPTRLAELMAGLGDPQSGERIYDPCCGSGELLVAALAQGGPPTS